MPTIYNNAENASHFKNLLVLFPEFCNGADHKIRNVETTCFRFHLRGFRLGRIRLWDKSKEKVNKGQHCQGVDHGGDQVGGVEGGEVQRTCSYTGAKPKSDKIKYYCSLKKIGIIGRLKLTMRCVMFIQKDRGTFRLLYFSTAE